MAKMKHDKKTNRKIEKYINENLAKMYAETQIQSMMSEMKNIKTKSERSYIG